MADKKISQLTALSAANLAPSTDVLAIVDTSATETKKVTAKDLVDGALNAGSANGVVYLNGSKAATSGTALVFDGSNLGLGVTPSAWSTSYRAFEFGSGSLMGRSTNTDIYLLSNSYLNTSGNFVYKSSAAAGYYSQAAGAHYWYNAASGTAGNTISFTQAMTLDADGDLGIGYTSPAYRLHIASAIDTYAFCVRDTIGNDRVLIGSRASAPIDNITPVQIANDNDGNLLLSSRTNSASGIKFYSNAGTAAVERARITSGGELLVGTSSTSASSNAGAKIYPAGTMRCVNADSTNSTENWSMYSTGAAAYRFYVGWGGTVYATNTTISAISDQRFKENIQDLDVGLDKIMALKPRKFDWKEGNGKDIKGDRGFIAQEFEQVFPDLVDEWRDPAPEGEEPYKSVRQDLIPVLVKAIQEQQAMIKSLEAKVAALESK